MIEAIIAGEEDPIKLADLAKLRLREKIRELQQALAGKVRSHHRFLLKEYMEEWKALRGRIKRLEEEIDRRIRPLTRPSLCGKACRAWITSPHAALSPKSVSTWISSPPRSTLPHGPDCVPATTRVPASGYPAGCATATSG